jgi:hypothetical protein
MATTELLSDTPFIAGSLLFLFVGAMLTFAPGKFISAARWWGKQIGLPQSKYQWNTEPEMTWRNWRLPGIGLLCFGAFLLFTILRSLFHNALSPNPVSIVPSVADRHHSAWTRPALDMIPIVLGLFVLARTETILSRAKRTFSVASDSSNGLTFARHLFRTIAFIAIIAGIVFLVRHILAA